MKVLSTRRYPGPAFDELEDVEVLPLAELRAPRPDVEGLVVANEPVPLELLPSLRVVANYSVGYDRVGVEACRERGVLVTNTPGVLDSTVADLAFGLILAARRQVVEGDRFVRSGGWAGSWSEGRVAEEFTGSTLGIVGLGGIGSAVARRARGFDLRVLYTRRSPVETDLGEYRELDALLAEADLVTLHVPLSPETRGLLDARRLALLRDGACLVNTARGEIVDERRSGRGARLGPHPGRPRRLRRRAERAGGAHRARERRLDAASRQRDAAGAGGDDADRRRQPARGRSAATLP